MDVWCWLRRVGPISVSLSIPNSFMCCASFRQWLISNFKPALFCQALIQLTHTELAVNQLYLTPFNTIFEWISVLMYCNKMYLCKDPGPINIGCNNSTVYILMFSMYFTYLDVVSCYKDGTWHTVCRSGGRLNIGWHWASC